METQLEKPLFLKAALNPAVPPKKSKKTAWVKSFSLVGADAFQQAWE